jgi:hypothetical protein
MATQVNMDRDALVSAKPVRVATNLGPFADEAAALAEVLKRLVAALDPYEIWLFGSRARGDGQSDSDFDLLVIAKPDGLFGSDDYVAVARPIYGSGIGCDVIPCGYLDYLAARAHPTTLVAMAVKEGRRLYAAPAD